MKLKTLATVGLATLLMLGVSLCQTLSRWIDGGLAGVAIAFADSGVREGKPGAGRPGEPASPDTAPGQYEPGKGATPETQAAPQGQPAPHQNRNFIQVNPDARK